MKDKKPDLNTQDEAEKLGITDTLAKFKVNRLLRDDAKKPEARGLEADMELLNNKLVAWRKK